MGNRAVFLIQAETPSRPEWDVDTTPSPTAREQLFNRQVEDQADKHQQLRSILPPIFYPHFADN
jgi:hypothetical protein